MKNFIIFLLLLLPFFMVAQKSENVRQDAETFVSAGMIQNGVFFSSPVVCSVNWTTHNLDIATDNFLFSVVDLTFRVPNDGQIYTQIETDEKKVFIIVSDGEGFRGVLYPADNLILDVEVSDIWAEMRNARK